MLRKAAPLSSSLSRNNKREAEQGLNPKKLSLSQRSKSQRARQRLQRLQQSPKQQQSRPRVAKNRKKIQPSLKKLRLKMLPKLSPKPLNPLKPLL